MKVTVKTVQQQTFQLETEPSDTIGQLKEKIQTQSQHQASWQKLIFSGQVLEDSRTVGSLNINESDFLVLMVRKPKAGEVAPPAAVQTPVAVNTNPLHTPPAVKDPEVAQSLASSAPEVTDTPVTTAPQTSQQSPQSSTGNTSSTGTDLVVGSDYEQTVSNLCEMGFTRENVIKALRAAFNNPDRAVEYLFNGIPEVADPAPATASPSTTTGGAAASQLPQQSGALPQQQQQQQQQGTPSEGTGVFDFLRQHPQFSVLRQMVQQNPSLLQPVLQQLGAQNPELLQLINTHQAEFIQLLNSPAPATGGAATNPAQGGGSVPPPGANYVQVTQEEKAAIDRLCNLGFDRTAVIEAFFACDKDETLAANYLLENGVEYEDDQDFGMPE